MSARVEGGDCLEVIPRLVAEGIFCDAVVTDPPYHLTATLKRFGAANSAPAQHGRDGAMARLSGGFMGQQWDGGDIAFRPETWATVATILRPGAFLVAFGGTRTYHRLVCAIEDGGFVIQDCILWLYATGFPKRRDMLKPAVEMICLAYKPGGKRTLQVDECRIEGVAKPFGAATESEGWRLHNRDISEWSGNTLGRWPANVCLSPDGGEYELRPGVTAAQRAEPTQSDSRGGRAVRISAREYDRMPDHLKRLFGHVDGSDEVLAAFSVAGERPTGDLNRVYGKRSLGYGFGPKDDIGHKADTGSAARFFFSAKAGAEDRWGSRHPTVKPVDLIAWLVKLVCPPGGLFLDPFAGSGTAAVAALKTGRNAILIEREAAYIADIRERIAFYEGGGTHSVQAKNRIRKRDEGPLFEREAAE